MPKPRTSGSDIIRAAGGLLWRANKAGLEIAVVRRDRYQDWSLPKGKLDSEETWQEGALREVREETGFEAKLLGFAGAVAYTTDKGPKVVRYWHMQPVGAQGQIEHDVSEVVWLPLGEARERLDYDLERAILDTWDGPDKAAETAQKPSKKRNK